MKTYNIIKPDKYFDSVLLMQVSRELSSAPGIIELSVMMGSQGNKDLLRESGLLAAEGENARGSDLLIAFKADGSADLDAFVEKVENALTRRTPARAEDGDEEESVKSLESAYAKLGGADVVFISLPGDYAAWEAEKALDMGMHVMLFSDNVPLEDEISLKKIGKEKGLLVMGPDCGTAFIGGVGLGFANAVREGKIGVVGAAGTGMQEVACIISNLGAGLSHGIGTGGRDVKKDVGGMAFLMGLEMLIEDPGTEIIILVTKPPDKGVEDEIIKMAAAGKKPVVACLLGSAHKEDAPPVHYASTLEQAAVKALELAGIRQKIEDPEMSPGLKSRLEKISPRRRFLRGLYSGGTLGSEAEILLRPGMPGLLSNLSKKSEERLPDPWKSSGDCIVDLGDDLFTRGRPHPMIDYALRKERMLKEATDPECAVILFDVVLGYGSNADPAGELEDALLRIDKMEGGPLLVAALCGAKDDPQGYERQQKVLERCGVQVCLSNASAVKLVNKILNKLPVSSK
ncbi:MAG: acyl-CoA synthetase FdrA [Chloroflexi bacterium]|nr:acyl-CoA synthetase FdrA [Chloroflexota bacterium]